MVHSVEAYGVVWCGGGCESGGATQWVLGGAGDGAG